MRCIVTALLLFVFCGARAAGPGWGIGVLPASVRMDPTSGRIYDKPYGGAGGTSAQKNWIFDGKTVRLQAVRGEYVSFQLVLTNTGSQALKGISVAMTPFVRKDAAFPNAPELFLEWAVEVKTPTTGYPRATLGKGWYPDALIPMKSIQQGTTPARRGWIYPLQLPDFNNRVDGQKAQLFWVDQYVPFEAAHAPAGVYGSVVSITIDGVTKRAAVELTVLDVSIPNENLLKASLQHEGFVSHMDEQHELEIYQLMKRNRVCVMDPTYKPESREEDGRFAIDWTSFDKRLKKYLTGEAFTAAYGYNYGPGYGTPVETFLLPFDVYGKHDTRGWPDAGTPATEKAAANRDLYVSVIRQVRDHLRPMVDTAATELTVYLNGLDESYFPEAWDRMAYYGGLFGKEYPEAHFRVDGGYNDSAMQVIEKSIGSWAVHTIEFNEARMAKYTKMGIQQWLYGPMIYESKINSWVGSSTFIDLPLVNDRAISWATWKYKAHSWISWGIGAGWKAAWYDPETWKSANDGGNAEGYDQKKMNGNALLIYSPGIVPNVDVACPSVRLKTMRDGVQEYELMRLLAKLDGNDTRVRAIVDSVIGRPFGDASVGRLDVWSYDPARWDRARKVLQQLIAAHPGRRTLPGSATRTFWPVETDSTLLNPGRGFTSTGSTLNQHLGGRLHSLCGVNQQRYNWDKLEPEEGKIDFAIIDSSIARAVRNGQRLNFRVMCQDEDMMLPKWAIEAGVKSPFYDNPVFIEKQCNLIRALGQRYDGNPGVCFVDIGTIGQWGEWHIDPLAKDPTKIVFPSDETAKIIIDAYKHAFVKTPLLSLIAFKQPHGFQYAIAQGAGWRADCWGDMDSTGWNHMRGVYPQALAGADAYASWQHSPVALETCWTMEEWHQRGWDIDYILGKALEWHATEVNNGTEAIPAEWYPKVQAFEKKLGYRLVLEEITLPAVARAGAAIRCPMRWGNRGVAPVYNAYRLVMRLVGAGGTYMLPTDADPRKWMPGATTEKLSVALPAGMAAGKYAVEVGLLDGTSNGPAIKLAMKGRTGDGWYEVGEMEVE